MKIAALLFAFLMIPVAARSAGLISSVINRECLNRPVNQAIWQYMHGGCSEAPLHDSDKAAFTRHMQEVGCCDKNTCAQSQEQIDYAFELFKKHPEMQECMLVDYASREQLEDLKCERDYIKSIQDNSQMRAVIVEQLGNSIAAICQLEEARRRAWPKVYNKSVVRDWVVNPSKTMYGAVTSGFRDWTAGGPKAPEEAAQLVDDQIKVLRASVWNSGQPQVQELIDNMISTSRLGEDLKFGRPLDCKNAEEVKKILAKGDVRRRTNAGYAEGDNEKYQRGDGASLSLGTVLGSIREHIEGNRLSNKAARAEDNRLFKDGKEREGAFKAESAMNCENLSKTSYTEDLVASRAVFQYLDNGTSQNYEKNDRLRLFSNVVCKMDAGCGAGDQYAQAVRDSARTVANVASVLSLGAAPQLGIAGRVLAATRSGRLSASAAKTLQAAAQYTQIYSVAQATTDLPNLTRDCFQTRTTTFGKKVCESINEASSADQVQILKSDLDSSSCVASSISVLGGVLGGISMFASADDLRDLTKVIQQKKSDSVFMKGLSEWIKKPENAARMKNLKACVL